MDLDGGDSINISQSPGVDWVYEAYEDKLYILSDRDTCHRCLFLYETDSKGSYWKKISHHQLADSWIGVRNNGTEWIVKREDDMDKAFQIIDASGHIKRSVGYNLPYGNDCAFSPDGQWISFRGGLTESKKVEGHNDELYLIRANGTEQRKLTSFPQSDTISPWWAYRAAPPRWRSDSLISYTSVRNGVSKLYTINPWTDEKASIFTGKIQPTWHDISRDGRYVVFDGTLDFKADKGHHYIFLIDREKRNTHKLSQGKVTHQAPVFVLR